MENWNIGFQMRMMPYFNSRRSRSKYNRSNTTNPSIPVFQYPKDKGLGKADYYQIWPRGPDIRLLEMKNGWFINRQTTRERRSEWSTLTYLLWSGPVSSGPPLFKEQINHVWLQSAAWLLNGFKKNVDRGFNFLSRWYIIVDLLRRKQLSRTFL